jgi:RNA polymerase sporulation-specific sigma factor
MLSALILLMLNGIFFALRLSDGYGSFPHPLPPAEEKKYLELCADGDMEARNKLIEHNLRLVAHIIKKYYTQAGSQDDLISIGTIGLIKGISTFKPDKNVRLATYASRCIENAILS